MRRKSTDIVGFAWNTEVWCPRDLMAALDGTMVTLPVRGDSPILDAMIIAYGIRVHKLTDDDDPRWKDSTVVPQPIFSGSDEADGATCGICGDEVDA